MVERRGICGKGLEVGGLCTNFKAPQASFLLRSLGLLRGTLRLGT